MLEGLQLRKARDIENNPRRTAPFPGSDNSRLQMSLIHYSLSIISVSTELVFGMTIFTTHILHTWFCGYGLPKGYVQKSFSLLKAFRRVLS